MNEASHRLRPLLPLIALLALFAGTRACLPVDQAEPDDDDTGPEGDDDATGDDDDATGDDDMTGDDDDTTPPGDDDDSESDDDDSAGFVPGEPLEYESPSLMLEGGHTYSVYLLGLALGPPEVTAWLLDDTVADAWETLPHVRYVHAAATASSVDYRVFGNLWESGTNISPATVSPDPDTYGFNYWENSACGQQTYSIWGHGDEPGTDPPLVPPTSQNMAADEYFSVILTGPAGNRRIVFHHDNKNPPPAGEARLGVFHSMEDVGTVSVELLAPKPQVLWPHIHPRTYGDKVDLVAGEYILRVTDVP